MLVLAAAGSLAAQAIPASPAPVRYSIRPLDGVVLGGSVILGLIPELAGTRLPYARCAPCDSSRLWGLDRGSIGLPRPGISKLGDGALVATAAGAGALIALTRRGEAEAGRAALADVAVLVEAVQLGVVASQWAKVAFHRARPVRYTSEAAQHAGHDDGRSFPSGHATVSFAAAAAAASILQRRHELGNHTVPVVLLFVGAATTSSLRVTAHRHFPTDVLAGAVLGTAVGWLVPKLHPIR